MQFKAFYLIILLDVVFFFFVQGTPHVHDLVVNSANLHDVHVVIKCPRHFDMETIHRSYKLPHVVKSLGRNVFGKVYI